MAEEPKQEETPKQETTASPSDDKDIEANKGMAALSYLGILVLVPLLAKKDSKFAQFHAKQGLVLLIAGVIGSFIFWIPFIGWILAIGFLIIDIIGLVNALSGKYAEVPILGQFGKKINL